MCENYVNYIRGRMYIGNANTRVEKRNLTSSGNKRMVRDIKYIIGRHVCEQLDTKMILNLLFNCCRWKVEDGGIEVVHGVMVDHHLFLISRPS